MSRDAIVITGAEVVTSLGASREETWRAVAAGRCGMGPLTALESPLPPGKLGGQAVELPADYESALPREVRYLKWTIGRALAEAGASPTLPYAPNRCGLMLGTTLHGMRAGGEFLRSGDYAPLQKFLAGSTLELAAADLACNGLASTTCSACSSSLGSVALAVTLLRTGQLDLVVCGGYDTVSEYAYGGFNSLRLVADGPLRPFGKDRQGMKLGEGYGILILERADAARERGAAALAEVLGWGESADAHHLTQPHPEGDGAARAMAQALKSAGVRPADVGLIAAHATGTPDNDAAEYAALSRVFGGDLPNVPAVGFKSHLGHTLGGAGAVELILSLVAMREQTVPPCASMSARDVEFPNLRLNIDSAKPARIRATLNTSLGFGGANTCVVLGPPPPSERAPAVHSGGASKDLRDVLVTGVGVIVPGAVGNEAFAARVSDAFAAGRPAGGGTIAEEEYVHLLNARRVRRLSEPVKLTLAARAIACQDAGIADETAFAETCGAVLGSTHGSAAYSLSYYNEIIKQGLVGANPMLFAEGVPNACSAHLSLTLGVKGACQTVIGTRTAGLDALRLAALRIAGGDWQRAIVAAAEEHNDVINAAYGHCGTYAGPEGSMPFADEGGFTTGSAAVAWILESRQSLDERGGGRVRGRVLDGASSRACGSGGGSGGVGAARDVLRRLGPSSHVISSANGTWVDRAELAAVRREREGAVVSSISGHVPETFSCGPLIGLAGVMLTGRMARLVGRALAGQGKASPAAGTESPDTVIALCTDYAGAVSGIRLAAGGGR